MDRVSGASIISSQRVKIRWLITFRGLASRRMSPGKKDWTMLDSIH